MWIRRFKGIVNVASQILPKVSQTPLPGSTLAGFPFFYRGVSNSGDNALVPNGYTSYQISPNLWLGLGINAPFGLSVSFQDPWAGRNYGLDTTIKSHNANPSIAYRINDWISIGVGVQLQYATFHQTIGLAPFPPSSCSGTKGWGWRKRV
jgi:long-chain fatty acid transport protein